MPPRPAKPQTWKMGRGKLGTLEPLLGTWTATVDTPQGPVRCTRTFARVLGKGYVRLVADWQLTASRYEEHAYFGVGGDGRVTCWSFTSDGKHSVGYLAPATDVHPQALAFEAEMPAGLARQVYWPGAGGLVHWAVEARTAKGWKRFTEHTYRAGEPA